MIVNGREYPMWSQFVERKGEWIGGILEDFGDSMDRAIFGVKPVRTTITDIQLRPNGTRSAYFSVDGKTFSCGFDVSVGGIPGDQDGNGWLVFSGYGGHRWRIKKPTETVEGA